MPQRLLKKGNQHPFLTALILSALVTVFAVWLVTNESNRRIADLNKEGQERGQAVVHICEVFAARTNLTFKEILDTFRQDAAAAGVTATPRIDALDLVVDRRLEPSFCSEPEALTATGG